MSVCDGGEIDGKSATDHPVGSKQHGVELELLVVRAVGVVDDKIGAALAALRFKFVELDRYRALLGHRRGTEAKQRTRQKQCAAPNWPGPVAAPNAPTRTNRKSSQ
jgi:hypothetical protein